MSTARRFALAAVSMAFLMCTRAEAGSGSGTGFEGWGGWNQLSMTDVNDTLSSFNHEYGTALAPIRNGHAWGFCFRFWPREDVLMRLGFERLSAQSRDSGVEFDLGAFALTLGATRYLASSGRFRCGLGVGLGPYFETGGLAAPGAELGASGWGFGGHVAGEAVLAIGGGCSLQGLVGYRLASIGKLKIGENTSDITAQYSGPFIRVGLAFDPPGEK